MNKNNMNKPKLIHSNKLIDQYEVFLVNKALANKIKTVKSTIPNELKSKKQNQYSFRNFVRSQPIDPYSKIDEFDEFHRTNFYDLVTPKNYFLPDSDYINTRCSNNPSSNGFEMENAMQKHNSNKDLRKFRGDKVGLPSSHLRSSSPQNGSMDEEYDDDAFDAHLQKTQGLEQNMQFSNIKKNGKNVWTGESELDSCINKLPMIGSKNVISPSRENELKKYYRYKSNIITDENRMSNSPTFNENRLKSGLLTLESCGFQKGSNGETLVKKSAEGRHQITSRKNAKLFTSKKKGEVDEKLKLHKFDDFTLKYKENDEIIKKSNFVVEQVIKRDLKRLSNGKLLDKLGYPRQYKHQQTHGSKKSTRGNTDNLENFNHNDQNVNKDEKNHREYDDDMDNLLYGLLKDDQIKINKIMNNNENYLMNNHYIRKSISPKNQLQKMSSLKAKQKQIRNIDKNTDKNLINLYDSL